MEAMPSKSALVWVVITRIESSSSGDPEMFKNQVFICYVERIYPLQGIIANNIWRTGVKQAGALLSSWMKRAMNRLQAVLVDVSVDLGGCNVCMSKHELDSSQIGTVCQEMGGKRVTEHMGRYWCTNTRSPRGFRNDLPEAHPCHGFCPAGYEKRTASSVF